MISIMVGKKHRGGGIKYLFIREIFKNSTREMKKKNGFVFLEIATWVGGRGSVS